MPISNWILGTCIDCKSETDFTKFDKFIGYLVHLGKYRCILLVSEIGLMSEAPIELNSENGYFYQNQDKNIEIVVLEWLDETPTMTELEIQKFLMEAAVHLEIHSQRLMETSVKIPEADA